MVDLRPAARKPGLADVAFVVFGGLVAHQLEGVLAFDQGLALGDLALEFDRLAPRCRPVPAAPRRLRLLVVVEFASRSGRWRGGRR